MKTLSEDRRALHRIPETGCRLPETAAYLRGALAEMPCTLLAPWEDADRPTVCIRPSGPYARLRA